MDVETLETISGNLIVDRKGRTTSRVVYDATRNGDHSRARIREMTIGHYLFNDDYKYGGKR